MNLAESTWTEVRDADVDVAFLPVGSTEQHGPHAPLATDALTATAVAEAAASRYETSAGEDEATARGEALVTPTVPVGVSEEHRAFDGTMWVSPDAFRAYVREAAASLGASGIDRIVFVNGHGGNGEALATVARRFSRESAHDGYGVAFTWFEAVGEHTGDMGHAGPLETALLRATHPELVREDAIESAREGARGRVHRQRRRRRPDRGRRGSRPGVVGARERGALYACGRRRRSVAAQITSSGSCARCMRCASVAY
jgi:creatinine amidohydrolase